VHDVERGNRQECAEVGGRLWRADETLGQGFPVGRGRLRLPRREPRFRRRRRRGKSCGDVVLGDQGHGRRQSHWLRPQNGALHAKCVESEHCARMRREGQTRGLPVRAWWKQRELRRERAAAHEVGGRVPGRGRQRRGARGQQRRGGRGQ